MADEDLRFWLPLLFSALVLFAFFTGETTDPILLLVAVTLFAVATVERMDLW